MPNYTNEYNQNHRYDMNHHAPESAKKDLFPVVKDNHGMRPASEGPKLPSISIFDGWARLKPQSSISNNLITSSQGQIEHEIRMAGRPLDLYHEISLTENGTGDCQINIYNLIDYNELLAPEDSTVLQTIYDLYMLIGDNMFLSLEQIKKRARILGFNESTFLPLTQTIPQGTTRKFYVPIPIFRSSPPETRHLRNPLILRTYTKSAATAVNVGSSSNLTLNSWDIIVKQLPLPISYFSYGVKHRYIHFQRNISTETLNANTYTDIRLTSLHGDSAFIFFVVRPQSVANENFVAFNKIDKFELRDSQNNIISALQHTDDFQEILRNDVEGELFNLPAYDNVYFFTFCLNPAGAYLAGSSSGSFYMTGDEYLRIYLPAGWVNGTYRVDVISAEYNVMHVTADNIKSTK